MTGISRVLVIDDDPMIRLLVSELLGRNGFEIIQAETGAKGLALFATCLPDLVLLDVMMPEMDGFDCLRALGADQSCRVPIVMMTAIEEIDCIEQAFELGASDFIGKPIHWPLLPYRVRNVLRSFRNNQLLLKQQDELKQSEERLRLSMQAAEQGFYDINVQTGDVIVNKEYASMLGYDPATFCETHDAWVERMHPDDQAAITDTYRLYLHGELDEYRVEYRQRCADGGWKWILSIGRIVGRDESNRPLRMLGTHTDINASKNAEERMKLLAKVFENSGEGIILCNAETRILSSNQAFTNITGYLASEVRNQKTNVLSSHRHDQQFYQRMWKALLDTGYWQGEVWDRGKNGENYPVWLGISAIRNPQGDITHFIGIFSDITERKAAEAKIEYLARHDPLTNLPNRTLLRDRFDQAMAHAARNHRQVALLFLDLDRFKYINDTFGHDTGDRLLQGVAERLTQCVREIDTVCRQGGDEFIVVLTDLPDVEAVSHIALKILDVLHRPFSIEGLTVSTSFSIGISLYPNDDTSFHGLLNKADTAMYAAKHEGRNTFRYFSYDMNMASIERMNIENGLRQALDKQEFLLYYQPLYSLRDNRIIGAEALLRWKTADGKITPPTKFIPIAEDTGLILPIGDWVLKQACRQNRRWHDAGMKLLITVNISALQFKRGNLVETVKQALSLSGLEPRYLELELTETVLIFDTQRVIDVIKELRALGVGFAIDDFGTGYSSLSYLKQFSVNKLKIDQSFVKELGGDENQDRAIVQAIIQLGETLGLQTLAEGVETREQAEQLALLGCEKAQGFYWHQPLTAEDFDTLLHSVGRE